MKMESWPKIKRDGLIALISWSVHCSCRQAMKVLTWCFIQLSRRTITLFLMGLLLGTPWMRSKIFMLTIGKEKSNTSMMWGKIKRFYCDSGVDQRPQFGGRTLEALRILQARMNCVWTIRACVNFLYPVLQISLFSQIPPNQTQFQFD